MKKIIFYYDGAEYWSDRDKHNADGNLLTAEIEKSNFEKLGYSVVLCNTCSWKDIQNVFELFRKDDVYFSMGINAAGMDLYMNDGKGLYECYDVPHITLNADQPYLGSETFYMGRLRNARCNNLLVATNNGMSVVDCMKLEQFQSSIKGTYEDLPFFEVDENALEYDRDIAVLYTGRLYENEAPSRDWNFDFTPDEIKDILNEVADYLESKAVSVYNAFFHVVTNSNKEYSIEALYSYFPKVFNYIIRWRRQKLVDTLVLADVPLTMCDASWREYKYANKMNILGTNRAGTMELYTRAKILVSDLAGFNNLTHGRNTVAMSRAVAVVSEHTKFLEEEFENKNAVKLYQWDNVSKVPDILNNLLENDARRFSMAKNAYELIKNKFTPENHTKSILSFVDKYLENRRGEGDGR